MREWGLCRTISNPLAELESQNFIVVGRKRKLARNINTYVHSAHACFERIILTARVKERSQALV